MNDARRKAGIRRTVIALSAVVVALYGFLFVRAFWLT